MALEDLPTRKGEVDLYIWDGVGVASGDLKAVVNKLQVGYYNTDGSPIYGFKPAGIMVNLYSAPIKYVTISLAITPETWSNLDDLKPIAENEVDRYFQQLKLGQTVVQSALEASIKLISGVYDVTLLFSEDGGVSWVTSNMIPDMNEIVVVQKPLVYA